MPKRSHFSLLALAGATVLGSAMGSGLARAADQVDIAIILPLSGVNANLSALP